MLNSGFKQCGEKDRKFALAFQGVKEERLWLPARRSNCDRRGDKLHTRAIYFTTKDLR
jgi:hypothetical protein